jgi:hypothetical protein
VPRTHRQVALVALVGALAGLAVGAARAQTGDKPAPAPAPAGNKGRVAFDHAAHAAKAKGLDSSTCATCHAVTKDGRNVSPGADGHKPCLDAGCHVKDFMTRGSSLCLTCHSSSDNFRKNPADQLWKGKKAFFVEMSHQAHMGRKVSAGGREQPVACQTCHWVDRATFKAIESPGHAQCAPCHVGSQAMPMSECDGCHREGDPATYFARQRKGVKLQHFAHEHVGHRFFDKEKMTQPIQCETCHYKVEKLTDLRELKAAAIIDTNTMNNNCAKCHDVRSVDKCGTCHTEPQTTIDYHGLK